MMRPVLVALGLLTCMHAATAGPLSLQDFFRGRLSAKGFVENFKDGTRRDFTMALTASWTGSTGTLVQDVAYTDGAREHKVWTFDKVSEGHFTGRREDVTRDATVIEDAEGIGMSYKANTRLPSGTTLNLAFDDRLTSVAPDTVTVRSDVSYLFIPAARVTVTITRQATR